MAVAPLLNGSAPQTARPESCVACDVTTEAEQTEAASFRSIMLLDTQSCMSAISIARRTRQRIARDGAPMNAKQNR